MIALSSPHLPDSMTLLIAALDSLSAILGMAGTYFMSKRYAKTFFSGVLFALLGLLYYLGGKGDKVRKFYSAESRSNEEIKDSPADMAFGLSLLFAGFLVALARILLSTFFGKT
jgi:hypothetical protein